MKNTLLVVVFAMACLDTGAQTNNFFADIGMSSGGYIPGVSFTYNRKLTKYFGVGAGIQGYEFTTSSTSGSVGRQFVPAVFADARVYLPVKRSMIFLLGDLGVNIYRSRGGLYERPHTNGLYNGVGVGYHYRMTKAGLGPYISLKLANDIYFAKQDYPGTDNDGKLFSLNADLVVSVGVKF